MNSTLLFTCLLLTAPTAAPAGNWPGEQWPTASPAESGLDETQLAKAREYALTGGGSGCVIFRGKLVMAWGSQSELYDLKSTSKSIGVTLLGVAMRDGKVRLDDLAKKHHPTFGIPPEANAKSGWGDRITLRMLADQTAGFDKAGGYEPLLFEPGTQWSYSDGGPNWLAECLTLVYKRDLNDVLFERVFAPIAVKPADIRWRKHAYRSELLDGVQRREFGSGFSANVPAMARIGYLYLRDGWWGGQQILPPSFMQAVRTPDPGLAKLPVRKPAEYGRASSHYSLLWWNNADGAIAGLPRDAYWSWGLYDSLIVVVPSLDLVAARAGKSWKRSDGADHYEVLKPFMEPLAAAARPAVQKHAAAPVPPSPVIKQVRWAAKETIVRKAKGSDNWPVTWGDDDALYTAYGDGNGFEPFVKEKLSLGLARVTGVPPDFQGVNLRAPSIEARGDGQRGRKASGLLMVEGVLYLWARNAGNSQLAWSADRGATWTWADWRFTRSFGCPTFLNFGKNYAGARDEFVYVYSHDADSAYERADRFVLARAPKDRVRDRAAYEFFVKRDGRGQPIWSADIVRRGAVFTNPGNCYRSHVSYNAGLGRYLWCQINRGNDTRFVGGFAIYDAPQPWGPWTTAFCTGQWDVGPGESSSLPTKWMSADGRTVYLVFSGDDCFSVRRATLDVTTK
jgi:CubicO group peptidase (beta-lactamase class C family)